MLKPIGQQESTADFPKKRRLGGNLALSIGSGYLVQIVAQATTVLTRLLLARLIAPTQWGVYGEAVVIIGIVDSLRELNLTQWAISGRAMKFWRDLPGAIFATTVIALLGLAALLPFLSRLSPELPITTAVLALTLIPRTWVLPAEAELNNAQRLFRLVRPQFAGAIGFVVSALILAAHYKTGWALSLATVVQVSVYSGLLLWSSRHEVHLVPRLVNAWRSLLSARDFVWLALAGLMMSQVDGLMVGTVAGATEAGFYIMASWLTSRLPYFVEIPLLRVMLPVFAAHRGDRGLLGDLFKRTAMGINVLEAAWCFLLIFNAGFVVSVVLGNHWKPAVTFVVLTAVYSLLSPLGTVGWEVLRMTGNTRAVLWNLIASSIAFLVIGVGLGLRFGAVGVVIGFYAATLINSLVTFVLPKYLGWPVVLDVLRQVAILYAACAVPQVLVGFLPLTPLIRFLVNATLMAVVVLVGMRPMFSTLRQQLAKRST